MLRIMSAILAFVACAGSPTPPERVTIDPGFTAEERATVIDALDARCEATGWCPDLVDDSGERGHIRLVHTLTDDDVQCPAGRVCKVAGVLHDESDILIARDRPAGLDVLWYAVAHEAGHYCDPGHTEYGLMSAYAEPGMQLRVDADAVAAWDAGCN
jgi:hypothetical protein